jgi:pyrroline-5-carboxylate reductase
MKWTGNPRVIRTIPNTPSLVNKGMTGMFAAEGVSEADMALSELVMGATGKFSWVKD